MPNWVTPRIAISGHQSARQVNVLAELGIRTVITLGEEVPRLIGTPYRHIAFPAIIDGPSELDDQTVGDVLTAINSATAVGPVLVHCVSGRSRSCGFVAAFLADRSTHLHTEAESEMAWQAALDTVRGGRPQMAVHDWIADYLLGWLKAFSPWLLPPYLLNGARGAREARTAYLAQIYGKESETNGGD